MAFMLPHPEFWVKLKPFIKTNIMLSKIQLITVHFTLLKGASMLRSKDLTKQASFKEVIKLI